MIVQTAISTPTKLPLSNLQMQLLKLYSTGVADDDLKAIQRLIVRYFAEKATVEANKDWDENGYTASDFLDAHLRSPYKSAAG